ncbi:MAG: sensor histidine kinase, partial [Firmicutes bacterium]|nr:sensor histidine kinase [Bacillota bacterium]
MTPPDDRITIFWILRLRWLTAVCQTAAVLISMRLFPDALAAGPLLGLVALGAGSNGWLWWRLRQPKPVSTALPGLVLGLDILLLTALLYGSGGPANPFTAIYLVHITLATV